MANIAHQDMDIKQRMEKDDVAENFFINEFCNYHNNKNNKYWYYKIGIDKEKAWGTDLINVSSIILNIPDFLCSVNEKLFFVEVKGCGDLLNMKIEHFNNYKKWNETYPVYFWICRPIKKIYTKPMISLLKMDDMINKNDYPTTTWAKYKNNPKDCNKPMWQIPFQDLLV